jgi:hypothetical protein
MMSSSHREAKDNESMREETSVSSGSEHMDTKEDSSSSSASAGGAAAAVTEATSDKPGDKPSPNTVIMFDWDDTLLASSFLSAAGHRLDTSEPCSPEVDAQLRALEQCVCTLLSQALKYGHVNIVTNAETGWVQLSAQKFMPLVVPMLSRVTVISARSTFEGAHPDAPLKWKFYAFHERLSSVFGADESTGSWSGAASESRAKNIVSFGDSHVEREAIRAVTRGVSLCRTKSVKFAERPTPEQLRRQLELVTNCFHYIHNHDADLDLQLTVTLNSPPASPSSSSAATTSSTHSPQPTAALPTTEVA